MILLRVWVERFNSEYEYNVLCDSKEEVEYIKQEQRDIRERIDGYYRFIVEELEINTITIDELKGLTLKEVKKLLDYAETL